MERGARFRKREREHTRINKSPSLLKFESLIFKLLKGSDVAPNRSRIISLLHFLRTQFVDTEYLTEVEARSDLPQKCREERGAEDEGRRRETLPKTFALRVE